MGKVSDVDVLLDGELSASSDAPELSVSTQRLRALCEVSPTTLPKIDFDLSEEEVKQLTAPAREALLRLEALWG